MEFRNFKNRKRPPEKINRSLRQILNKYGLASELDRYSFVLNWEDIVGEEIAKITKPECFRNSCLVIRVTDPIWAQELSFQKDIILKRLRKYLKINDHINDLKFYVGKID